MQSEHIVIRPSLPERVSERQRRAQRSTIERLLRESQALSGALEQLRRHHAYTEVHSRRVAALTWRLLAPLVSEDAHGEAIWLRRPLTHCPTLGLELSSSELDVAVRAALAHDLGKLALPVSLLDETGRLSESQWRQIRSHASVGADICTRAESLRELAVIVLHHHERWDGRGYPEGLAGSEIPFPSRVIAVCDAFEAMTASERVYNQAQADEAAFARVRSEAGTAFDPDVIELLEQHLEAHSQVLLSL